MRHRVSVTIVLLIMLGPADVDAQRNCKTGKPCGNTCISKDKVCHVGTTSQPPPAPATLVAPAPTPAVPGVTVLGHAGIPAGDSAWPFVANRQLRDYYANVPSCAYAARIPPAERVFFRARHEAESWGLLKSVNPGC